MGTVNPILDIVSVNDLSFGLDSIKVNCPDVPFRNGRYIYPADEFYRDAVNQP